MVKPSFPTNYDELVQNLLAQGSFSFEVKTENKDKLLKALDRCRRDRVLLAQADSLIGRLKWLIYGLYVTFLNEFTFRNDKNGSSAVNYFYIAIDYISSIEGKELNDSTTKITYVARN